MVKLKTVHLNICSVIVQIILPESRAMQQCSHVSIPRESKEKLICTQMLYFCVRTKTTKTYLQYLDLFPEKSLRFGQILLIYAFDCHFPIMLLKMSMI